MAHNGGGRGRRAAGIAAAALAGLLALPAPAGNRGVPVDHRDVATGRIESAADTDLFMLDLPRGTRLSATVRSRTAEFRPALVLRRPDGAPIDPGDRLRGVGLDTVRLRPWRLGATGSWGAEVASFDGATGVYEASFRVRRPRSVTERGIVIPAGATVDVPFGASPGARVSAVVRRRSGPALQALLVDPDGVGVRPLVPDQRRLSVRRVVLDGAFGSWGVRLLNTGAAEARVDVVVRVRHVRHARRAFTLGVEPRPVGVVPGSGPHGTPFRVTGSAFEDGAEVWFGDTLATDTVRGDDGSLTGTAPRSEDSDEGRRVAVAVRNPDGQENALDDAFLFIGVPRATSVTPGIVPVAGGEPLVIGGRNFRAGVRVDIGGEAAAEVVVVSTNTLTCVAPPHPEGPASIVITDALGRSGAPAGGLVYVGPPTALSAAPAVGAFTGGTSVVLTGRSFHDGVRLFVDGEETARTIDSFTTLAFTLPPGAAGPVVLHLEDAFGQASDTDRLLERRGPLRDRTAAVLPPAPAGGDFFAAVLGAGDLDGDGLTDLMGSVSEPGADEGPAAFWVLLGDGVGGFVAPAGDAAAALTEDGDRGQADALAVGDLDGDGADDVLLSVREPRFHPQSTFERGGTTYAYEVYYTYGGGSYTFEDDPTYVATRILGSDGDGGLERRTGGLPTPPSTPYFGYGERWQAAATLVGDLDGDTDPDVVLIGTDLMRATISGRRTDPSGVVVLQENPGIYTAGTRVLRNDESAFTEITDAVSAPTYAVGGAYYSYLLETWDGDAAVLGDVDGDHDLDLVLARSYPRYVYSYDPNTGSYSAYYVDATRVLRNDGTGRFAAIAGAFPASPGDGFEYGQFDVVALGDLDGDGDADLVGGRLATHTTSGGEPLGVYSSNGGSGGVSARRAIRVLRNDGGGRFAEATTAFLPVELVDGTGPARIGEVTGVGILDLDGDGRLDLVVAGRITAIPDAGGGRGPHGILASGARQATRILLNRDGMFEDATGTWWPHPAGDARSAAASVFVGDLDADGAPDVVLGRADDASSPRPLRLLRVDDGR